MKGTTIYFSTAQLWDITFALNSMITHYEQWENSILEFDPKNMNDKTKDETLIYVRENLKKFKSLKNKIETKVKSLL